MKHYFVVADVHSFFDEMMGALRAKGFDEANADHVFVSLGDLLDRGPNPLECLSFVNALPNERKILVRGNHEDLLQECIEREGFKLRDYSNGTEGTVLALSGLSNADFYHGDTHAQIAALRNHPALCAYYDSLVTYGEVGDYVFVHGWIPRPLSEDSDWRDGIWYQARWLNGMQEWHEGRRLAGKTIVCGHWHTSWGHAVLENRGTEFGEDADFSPFVADGILALDACTALSHRANCALLTI